MNKFKLIRIYIDKKYILAFRIIMLLISWPFVVDVYEIISTGIADTGKYISVKGEDWGYYAYLSKKLAFSLFFIWLGSFGVQDKALASDDEKSEK